MSVPVKVKPIAAQCAPCSIVGRADLRYATKSHGWTHCSMYLRASFDEEAGRRATPTMHRSGRRRTAPHRAALRRRRVRWLGWAHDPLWRCGAETAKRHSIRRSIHRVIRRIVVAECEILVECGREWRGGVEGRQARGLTAARGARRCVA